MKNKPSRHKSTNTFKFKRFSERVSEIDVDVFHRVAHRYEEQSSEGLETFFYQTLQKWSVLNLTEGYSEFKKEVRNVVTLPQLLNQRQEIVDILMKYLKRENNISYLEPILELIVAVARDLQKDFYVYFPDFLQIIIQLLHTKDAEQLELAFTCLAYLFKFLWRYLIKNVDATFELLVPLLAESKPAYVNNFAAESFAFVVRKVKDRDSFFRLVLKNLEEKRQGTSGCGRLMFEVISGTSGQFHSCAESMLTLYLEALEDESIDLDLVYDVVKKILDCVLDNIEPHKCDIFWTVLLRFIERRTQTKIDNDDSTIETKKSVILLFRLINDAVAHRNGRMLTNPGPLEKKLVRAIDVFQSNEETLRSITDVAISVLLASSVKLSQETASELVLKLLSIKQRELNFHIVERLVDYSSFETLVLPHLLKTTIREGFDDSTLDLFASIVNARAPHSLNGLGLTNWKKFPIDFRGAAASTLHFINETLANVLEGIIDENAFKTLLILPHFNPIPDEFVGALKNCVICAYKKLIDIEDPSAEENDVTKYLLFVLLGVESLIHILGPDDFHNFFDSLEPSFLEIVKKYPHLNGSLNVIDLILSHLSGSKRHREIFCKETFERLNDSLVAKLSSPFHETRLIVSHIYSLFRIVEELKIAPEKNGKTSALELLYLAESEPATVHKYRERLVHIQALTFQSQAVANLHAKYYDFPLRYLLGQLSINFSLLWDPVCKGIATYATKECPQFWPIFMSALTQEIPKEPFVKDSKVESTIFQSRIITSILEKLSFSEDKPDLANYKLLLWKCMTEFTDFCETKNRDLTGLFIENVESNYFKSNTENARSWSIEKRKDSIPEQPMEVESEEEEEEEDDSENKVKPRKITKKSNFQSNGKSFETKVLLAQMKLFAKVNSPKTLYRETEMRKIYLELLMSKNVEIQKAALDCLFAYKPKYLLSYKENLYSLIDEKNLKNELARFRIDEESGMLKDEDREGLMPVLMRLIYAKMAMRVGMRTGGKGGALVRRKIILRFLGGSREDEMMIFTRMAFKPFEKFVSLDLEIPLVDPTRLIMDVVTQLDLSNVIPPKRLRSAVNLLAIVIEQFGAKMMEKLLPRLLAILFCITAQAHEILRKSENVLSGYLPTIKSLRNTCVSVIARFFTHFESYDWKSEELDAMFEVAAIPLLEKLPIEGIHSPTALLKLFQAWADNPRYYKLLIKHQPGNTSVTPLPYVMRLLLGPKTHVSVINAILEMLEKLLTLVETEKMDVDEEEKAKALEVGNILAIEDNTSAEMNYGSLILMPHVPEILRYMKNKLARSTAGRSIDKTELVILSRLSELAKDPETSDELLRLLVPILVKRTVRGAAEQTIFHLLTTILNLIKNVEKPEIHLRSIVPLLGSVAPIPARKLLLKLVETIAAGYSNVDAREEAKNNANLVARLNAWDQKWIEQPDFEKRLDAFTEIALIIKSSDPEKSMKLSLEFGVGIIYTCYFFLAHETDLSLRDSAGQCLKILGPELARCHKENNVDRRYFMDETIFNVVRSGIRSKNDVVRNQSIGFLGDMALECPDVHPVLRDLSLLANREDREVDFFENLQHLQLHRRVRALLKFCSTAKTLKRPPNPKTLTQFIFPIASSYLCNFSYSNKNSIVDAAIEAVGTICRLLPWHQYEIILKHYLDKLGRSSEFQRQIVRTLVAILDAFHYDLSKLRRADGTEAATLEAPVGEISENPILDSVEESAEAMDEALDEALDHTAILDDSEKIKVESKLPEEATIMEKQSVLSQYASKKVVFDITHILLPQLHRSIIARTQHENSHKINRRQTGADREEEELMRVPIALAMVQLLQKLPDGILEKNLPGIFMKLCTFLKSRLDSVRRATREILQKIMIALGPDYLHHLLREMNSLLTRGFQIHVLAYTIHAVLVALKGVTKDVHARDNLQGILSVCKMDLFGPTGEEKEVAAIAKSVSEARTTKSYDIFGIIAQFVPESCLLDLIVPLKEILGATRSHRTVRKVVECLRHVVLGLADNSFIAVERILVFIYGIVSDSIPELLPAKQAKPLTEKESQALRRQKSDCYIIAPEPKSRMGLKLTAKVSADTNAHVMMEFALKLCHILLKRERVTAKFESYLDPFVSILANCLDARRVKLSTLALQCLNWIVKMDLPSVRESVADISSSIFGILHKYAAQGLSKGDNFDLVMASFKCMSVLVRDVKHLNMSNDQTKALILYAEQDLHDSDKQATAFNLLKAIVSRKIIINEMHAVMEKVGTLSVTSELDHVRQQSRSLFYSFLMEYPLGKQLDKHISFYLSQLTYEMKPGRLSALEMIHSIVTGFPVDALVNQSGLLFLMIGVRLINDEDPTCRKLCAKCIKEIITRVPHNQRVKLFDIVQLWLKDSKVTHRTLAAQLCGIFVNVEKDTFESRLADVLPLILKQFHAEESEKSAPEPGRFVKLHPAKAKRKPEKSCNLSNIKDPERMKDHHLFQTLQLCLKVSANCPNLFNNDKYEDSVRSLAEHGQSFLAHPHLWIRLAATQLIGFVLAGLNEDKIQRLLENPEETKHEKGYLYADPVETLRSLSLDLAAQLQPDMEFEELADQVVKNLVFIARVVKNLKIDNPGEKKKNNGLEADKREEEAFPNVEISLLWLLKRLRKCVNVEITQSPKSTSVRMAVFKWIAGVSATVSMDHLRPILFQLMSPLVREMSTTEESNAPLRQLAKEVATMLKKSLGIEDYARLLAKVQQKLDTRKTERKKIRTQQYVTDPELAAKRKIARQQKKKVARKRRMTEMKGKRPANKRPRKQIDLEAH